METRGRNIDRTYHRSRSYLLHRHGIHIGQQWDDKETRRSMYIWCISTFLYRDSRLQWEAWDVGWRREFQFFEGEVRRENQNGPIDGQSLFLYRHWTTMEATWAYYGPISRGAQWLVPTRGDPLRIIEEHRPHRRPGLAEWGSNVFISCLGDYGEHGALPKDRQVWLRPRWL